MAFLAHLTSIFHHYLRFSQSREPVCHVQMQQEHGNNWSMIGKRLTDRAGRKVLRLKRDGAHPLDSMTRFRRSEFADVPQGFPT